MLIKFIPEAPQPTVLFSLAFPELEERGVQKPHAWNIQLSALSNEDLEVPSDSHALDKAAGIPSLLDEVLFDVPARAVSCRYQDGAVLQWRMEGVECLRALSRVLEDVNESAAQQERDEQRSRAEQKKAGRDVAKSLLFFGCRQPDEDYLYGEVELKEWASLGIVDVRPAFSRRDQVSEGCRYVQQ